MKKNRTKKLFIALAALVLSLSPLSAKVKRKHYTRGEVNAIGEAQDSVVVEKIMRTGYTPNEEFLVHVGDQRYTTRGKIYNSNGGAYKIMDSKYGFIEVKTDDEVAALCGREFLVKTNLLYWFVGGINLGFEYRPNKEKSVSYVLNGGYGVLHSDNWAKNFGGWFISPEVRFYMGQKRNWFLGVQYIHTDYNIRVPSLDICMKDGLGRIGRGEGVGAVAGVKLPIIKKLDVEFCVGLGAIYNDYDAYDVRPYAFAIAENRYIREVKASCKEWNFAPLQLSLNIGLNLAK